MVYGTKASTVLCPAQLLAFWTAGGLQSQLVPLASWPGMLPGTSVIKCQSNFLNHGQHGGDHVMIRLSSDM